ncbi:MAG: multiheme c-type cytochrome, partial [Candidatus Zixiibacteriota bacterium]
MARLTHGITLAVFLIGVSLASPGCDSGESEADINAFLDNHWSRPLRPQGEPPATFPVAETRLDAGSCGVCHPDQIRDWSGSFHSRAMSPGLLGQLMDMAADDREGHQACLRCHAPLAEQAEELVS